MPRRPANPDIRMKRLGADLALEYPGAAGWWEDGDLRVVRRKRGRDRDLDLVTGVESADQMLINRLKTHKGELTPLGHPEYGSRHHELIGEPNVERTRRLIKLYVLEALSHEPRIEKVLAIAVTAPPASPSGPPRDQVRIVIDLKLIDEDRPRNLVVPFSLEPSP
ncbi:MAG: GPW/gp25 family protein [Desulfococcaceae bacterium]